MNWQKQAIEELQQYSDLSASLRNLSDRIMTITYEMQSVKTSSPGAVPVKGGDNKYDDRILNLMVEKERLSQLYRANKRRVELMNNGLKALTSEERKVLERFYISRPHRHIDILMDELGYEKTQIYRIKDRALYRYTINQFGLPEF